MCKVYNQVGCLTAIKSHLHEHNINDCKSVKDLIDFRKNYPFLRQQIISSHELLIEQEKKILSSQIIELGQALDAKKREIQRKTQSAIEGLNNKLANLSFVHANAIHAILNYFKKIFFKLRIWHIKLTLKFKVEHSVKHLKTDHNKKNTRHNYITMCFDAAVMESALSQLQEIDRKKGVIDEINNSIYGAIGEREVVKELNKLSDDYILINDFTCSFDPPIYNYKENDYIKSVQVDHILVSPAGIFLIETKNWSQHSLENLSLYSPVQQIKRANFVLYKILNNEITGANLRLNKHHWGDRKIQVKNLIVLINHRPIEDFQFVKVLAINNLLSYINYFKPNSSFKETQIIADYLLNFTEN
jgi:hypothetical protein